MKYLELTYADPARNLACDEALLEKFEREGDGDGLLRLWQPENYFVVLGHSNRLAAEANVAACAAGAVPILRRTSGGGAVLQGPGCLNYSLILDCQAYPVANIASAFRYVLERHRQWLAARSNLDVRLAGLSDLALDGRKFSGNAQYRKLRYALVHGTFLVQFDLAQIERYLLMPAKQPDYRQNRPHGEFVTNLNLESRVVAECLKKGWRADGDSGGLGLDWIDALVDRRYGRSEWTEKF